jgi:hypothetical protein
VLPDSAEIACYGACPWRLRERLPPDDQEDGELGVTRDQHPGACDGAEAEARSAARPEPPGSSGTVDIVLLSVVVFDDSFPVAAVGSPTRMRLCATCGSRRSEAARIGASPAGGPPGSGSGTRRSGSRQRADSGLRVASCRPVSEIARAGRDRRPRHRGRRRVPDRGNLLLRASEGARAASSPPRSRPPPDLGRSRACAPAMIALSHLLRLAGQGSQVERLTLLLAGPASDGRNDVAFPTNGDIRARDRKSSARGGRALIAIARD